MRRIALAMLMVAVWGAPAGGQVSGPAVLLTPVGIFQIPVGMATRAGDDALYVVEKLGTIRALRGGIVDPVPVLDVSSEVSNGLEQGLLGLAFSADGGLMYVNLTDSSGDTRVLEFAVSGGRAVTASRRELLFVDQPFANHNGGNLEFGPDGYLYLGLGDGGSAGDPMANGQNVGRLLGKILRIDPRPSGGAQYGIPPDNPFVSTPGARPEIWAYGVRNPWRFSFDRETGDLWIADVGQNIWEEINIQKAGAGGGQNYGWDRMEGTHPFAGATAPPAHVPPIWEYRHENGSCSVTGGYVYRGAKITGLRGAYVYSDWCDSQLRYVREVGGHVISAQNLSAVVPLITAFGQDQAGELYAMSLSGLVFRLDPLLF